MTQKKTVLHIIARMNVGGTARYLETLLPELTKSGFESVLATGYTQGEEVESNGLNQLDFYRIPRMGRKINPVGDFIAYMSLKKLVRELKPDIIHSHTFKAGLLGRLLSKRIPKVHTFHGHLFQDPTFGGLTSRMILLIERRLARKSQVLVTVGQNVALDMQNRNIGTKDQYKSIPPGIQPLNIPDKSQADTNLGLNPHSAMTIGWLARMTNVKNPLMMVEIAKLMPKHRFLMGGGGDLLDEVRLKAPKNMHVLGWVNAADLIGASDVMVSTSHNEGIPISVIESQMAGIPVVATEVGSIAEVVIDKVTGFLTNEGKDEMVEKLNILVSDKQIVLKMSKSSKTHALDKFSVTQMVQSHIEIYRKIIGVK